MEDIIKLQVLLQSVLHKIEDIDDRAIFKQQLKQTSNRYYNQIEKFVEGITKEMNLEESNYHIEIVNKIDRIVNDIKIEVK
jgi:hypothetical protein